MGNATAVKSAFGNILEPMAKLAQTMAAVTGPMARLSAVHGNVQHDMAAAFRPLVPWLRVRALIAARRKAGEVVAALWQALARLVDYIASFAWPPLAAGEAGESPPSTELLVTCLFTSGSPHCLRSSRGNPSR